MVNLKITLFYSYNWNYQACKQLIRSSQIWLIVSKNQIFSKFPHKKLSKSHTFGGLLWDWNLLSPFIRRRDFYCSKREKRISACHGKYSILICFALCFGKYTQEDILLFTLTNDKKCLTSTASPSVQHQEVADTLSLQKQNKEVGSYRYFSCTHSFGK